MAEQEVKIGGKEKLEVASASLKTYANTRLSVLEGSPELLNSKDFNEGRLLIDPTTITILN